MMAGLRSHCWRSVAVADLLYGGAARPASSPGGRSARRSQRAPAPCLRAAEDQDPEHAEPRGYRGDVRRGRALRRLVADWVQIERIEGGKVALFLPGSPDPWSALSASRRRPASRPSICLWPPSPIWRDGSEGARMRRCAIACGGPPRDARHHRSRRPLLAQGAHALGHDVRNGVTRSLSRPAHGSSALGRTAVERRLNVRSERYFGRAGPGAERRKLAVSGPGNAT